MDMEIKDLDKLLSPVLGSKKIKSYKTKNLMGPGENYGSIMLAVDVQIEDCDDELHLVAKLCPPTEFIKKMFNIPITFKKEVDFYSAIIPSLQEFQKEQGCDEIMDLTPKYFGSRLSLDPESSEVDDDACLLLENIKVRGFDIGDRLKGFDLATAEFLVKDLAVFHAVPIAFREINPEGFNKKILNYIPKHINDDTINEEMNQGIINTVLESSKKHPECAKYLERIEKGLNHSSEKFRAQANKHEGVFTTLIHSDFWVNNTMLKYCNNGKPIKNSIVDFQLITYGNPANDLIFFIYSSLSNEIISAHYDHLIRVYYNKFIDVLKSLKVNTEEFSFEKFEKEIDRAAADIQFYHISFMLKPILTEKDKVKNLSDLNQNELLETESLSERYYEKLWFTVMEFVKRGWI